MMSVPSRNFTGEPIFTPGEGDLAFEGTGMLVGTAGN